MKIVARAIAVGSTLTGAGLLADGPGVVALVGVLIVAVAGFAALLADAAATVDHSPPRAAGGGRRAEVGVESKCGI